MARVVLLCGFLCAMTAGNIVGQEAPVRPAVPIAPAQDVKPAIPAIPLVKPKPLASPPPAPAVGPESLQGEPCPDFEMMTITEDKLTNASLQGKVLLIDFWATWCGPCIKASPVMQSLHDKYAEKGLVVIGANTSERDREGNILKTPERAKNYAQEHNYTYTFTYGTDDFKNACHVRGIPTMLVVDQKGRVNTVVVGWSAELETKLEGPIVALLEANAD